MTGKRAARTSWPLSTDAALLALALATAGSEESIQRARDIEKQLKAVGYL